MNTANDSGNAVIGFTSFLPDWSMRRHGFDNFMLN